MYFSQPTSGCLPQADGAVSQDLESQSGSCSSEFTVFQLDCLHNRMRQRQRGNQRQKFTSEYFWHLTDAFYGAAYNKQLTETDRQTPRLESVGAGERKPSQENNVFFTVIFCLTYTMA